MFRRELNVPYTYPPINFLKLQDYITNLVNVNGGVYWPLDDAVNNPFNRVINPAVAVGRNLVLNGTFDSGTGWTLNDATTTITGGVLVFTAGTTGTSRAVQIIPVIVGRAYKITYTVSGYVSGTVQAFCGNAATITVNASANGTFTGNVICLGTVDIRIAWSTGTLTCNVDNIIVQELNIPASIAVPIQLLNTDVWNGLGVGAWTPTNATLSAQTTTRHDGVSGTVLRVLNSSSNGIAIQSKFVIGSAYRIYGWMRSNGTALPRVGDPSGTVVNGTVSTDWQPFDFVLIAISTSFQLRSSGITGVYSEFDVTVVALDTGIRTDNAILGGDFSADKYWIKGTGWTISGGTAVCNAAAPSNLSQSGGIVSGKKYLVTFTVSSFTSGGVVVQLGTTNGTSRSANGTYSEVIVSNGVSIQLHISSTFVGNIDDIVVTELSPLVALPVNGAVLGNAESNRLLESVSFDGVNDLINLYSTQLNSIFPTDEGTLVVFGKFIGSWTDGVARYYVHYAVDGNNDITIAKNTPNNTIIVSYKAGGVTKSTSITYSQSTFTCLALTWSKSSDEVKIYLNGLQQGTTLTGLGTWVGNIVSNSAVVGANTTSAGNPFNGSESQCVLVNKALSASEVAEIAKLGDTS